MIKFGEDSEQVKDLQTRLQKLRLDPGPVDGKFGNLTLSAWTQFEQQYLVNYKIITDEEWQELVNLTPPSEIIVSSGEEKHFLDVVIPLAQAVMAKTGLPASVSVGQAIIETGYGQSELAKQAHNYHGIKAGFGDGPLLPKEAFPEWTGKVYLLKDDEDGLSRFMKFNGIQDSFWSHDRWFTYWDHYHPYFAHAQNPKTFLELISRHYATNPAYFQLVWAAIKKHNLTTIDQGVTVSLISPWKELYAKSTPANRTYTVAIMPGHGGTDPGACNSNLGVKESAYNWLEAQEIKQILEANGLYKVEICRQENELCSLDNFKDRANKTNADLCLCLHHNACNEKARGWWLFYADEKPEYRKLAATISNHFKELPLFARGYEYAGKPFEQDWFNRVWNCIYGCKMPTVLLESCFVDNDQDCQWLKDGGYKVIAKKIADGVRDYLENR